MEWYALFRLFVELFEMLQRIVFWMVVIHFTRKWIRKHKALREAKMPVAVVTEPDKRVELKSAPPDGYVIIRRMTHGEKMHRRGMTKLTVDGSKRTKNVKAEIDMLQKQVSYWEFANLIVEHNLQDKDGRPLNFRNPADVDKLDGKIGEEVDTAISDFNNFEEDMDDEAPGSLGNSSFVSEPAS